MRQKLGQPLEEVLPEEDRMYAKAVLFRNNEFGEQIEIGHMKFLINLVDENAHPDWVEQVNDQFNSRVREVIQESK
jgi:hypothetical protein